MFIRDLGNYWLLESGDSAYAFGLDEAGVLAHCYWGARLPNANDYPRPISPDRWDAFEPPAHRTSHEIGTGERGAYSERTIDITFSNRERGFAPRFKSASITGDTLDIVLVDAFHPFEARVRYTILAPNLFERSISVTNTGSQAIKLERLLSASFNLPGTRPYAMTHLDGRWGDEFRINREPFVHGAIVRESRRMTTSVDGTPFFAIDRNEPGYQASESGGDVWFGALRWSGNWKLIAEQTRNGHSLLHIGINDHDFAWDLTGGETLTTPGVVFGFTREGFGAASRLFHDLVRDHISPRPGYSPPVIYNSWYATKFDVEEKSQIALAESAARMGVEMFVVDDGWFAGRKTAEAGLGDWWPDPDKFPDGFARLAEAVGKLGMQFGVWIEPEMVNPNSALYRNHPDWIIHFPNRDRTLLRHQSMLNLARLDVQDYLITIFDKLLSENPIDFIKWDMNRNVTEPGWPDAEREPREIWIRYVEGLYRVWGELRRRHPNVIWENCSGGGGRVDLAMMALTEQSWVSDNTVPRSRLQIQEGYSQLFPASTMAAWVTDEERSDFSLALRFHVSMMGALGVGGNLLDWSADEQEQARIHIQAYKDIRHLIVGGDLYRLRSAHAHATSAAVYVAKDKSEAVLFVFRVGEARWGMSPAIYIDGLADESFYTIEGIEGQRSGAAWRELGAAISLNNLESTVRRIRQVA